MSKQLGNLEEKPSSNITISITFPAAHCRTHLPIVRDLFMFVISLGNMEEAAHPAMDTSETNVVCFTFSYKTYDLIAL